MIYALKGASFEQDEFELRFQQKKPSTVFFVTNVQHWIATGDFDVLFPPPCIKWLAILDIFSFVELSN
jgi:hypothetical protein